jgi:hypothetical protein
LARLLLKLLQKREVTLSEFRINFPREQGFRYEGEVCAGPMGEKLGNVGSERTLFAQAAQPICFVLEERTHRLSRTSLYDTQWLGRFFL